MSPNFFIFGAGYTATALMPELITQGFKVIGTSRTPQDAQPNNKPNNLDMTLINFNSQSLQDLEDYLSHATHILICIPPTSLGCDLVLAQFGDLIKKQASHLKWLGYLSSTGVYGDHKGRWVTEESACIPQNVTGIARLKAEEAWFNFAKGNQLSLHIFRLSGIYGSGRNVLERILKGKKQSIFKENQVFCRIHVEDIVSTLLASMHAPNPLSIYNISDDKPAPTHEVDNYAASLLHRKPLPLIPFAEAHLSPMEQEFYSNNRRVSNLKIKKELHVVLKYPTYQEGLTHILKKKG